MKMSQWVSNYAYDLSVAQGHGVPRGGGGVASDEKPSLHIPEDTEEQVFRDYMGASGDSRPPPDLSLIQKMLEMVRVDNSPPQQNGSASMLNPNCAEFVPQYNTTVQHTDKCRNVALKSLLEADDQKSRTQNLRLLKPDDIIKNNMAFARESQRYLLMQPNDMFKRKTPQKVGVSETTPELNNNTYNVDMYEPSEFAFEYYKKYMERAELKTYFKDDIWVKTEKKIKEIEKRMEAEQPSEWGLIDGNQNLNLVRLPHHRHQISEECVVCDMVKKHSFNIEEMLSEDKRM